MWLVRRWELEALSSVRSVALENRSFVRSFVFDWENDFNFLREWGQMPGLRASGIPGEDQSPSGLWAQWCTRHCSGASACPQWQSLTREGARPYSCVSRNGQTHRYSGVSVDDGDLPHLHRGHHTRQNPASHGDITSKGAFLVNMGALHDLLEHLCRMREFLLASSCKQDPPII